MQNPPPGTSLPSGTVTFLFTDIEGSTKRWETTPAAMQAAFARQEAILRQAIDANGGYAYKMIGDAFQAAFPTAPQALLAALDAQRALHSESWPTETAATLTPYPLPLYNGERIHLLPSAAVSRPPRGRYKLRPITRRNGHVVTHLA